MNRILGIIPARYGSTRFPGKPLVEINGIPMIIRVYEQSLLSGSLHDVVVATDDVRIVKVVEDFGGLALMTNPAHGSGTERCNEIVQHLEKDGSVYDVIINIQGDEPYVNPKQIDQVAYCFNEPGVSIATLAKQIQKSEELFSPHVVKVIFNLKGDAVYFSRHPIPYRLKKEKEKWISDLPYYKHIGIYGYTRDTLSSICSLKPTQLETAESLEQLRWIENGFKIKVAVTRFESHSVDTPEDLSKFFNRT